MANPISSDNFSAHQTLKQRNTDAGLNDSRAPRRPDAESQTAPSADSAQVNRAHRRFAQEGAAAGDPAIRDAAGARRQVAALKDLLNTAPQAAVAAHSGIDGDVFEAAMARPTA